MRPSPYQPPFPRFYVEQRLKSLRTKSVHPLHRSAYEPYFKRKNPDGYWHDLGAQDVFLDNFGLLVAEQFSCRTDLDRYLTTIHTLLAWWELAYGQVIQQFPWWGKHLNSADRRAATGEPRSLLRFLGGINLGTADPAAWLGMPDESLSAVPVATLNALGAPMVPGPRGMIRRLAALQQWPSRLRLDFEDWPRDLLVPADWLERPQAYAKHPLGSELPEGFSPKVEELIILHPMHSTPDLPLRVGLESNDIAVYSRILRNQGRHPTCVANAAVMALEVALHRARIGEARFPHFSAAWMHCASAKYHHNWDAGRSSSKAMEILRKALPCSEEAFPYEAGPAEFESYRTDNRVRNSADLTRNLGLPLIRELDPKDIAGLKVHLAAGWVVIVSTAFPEVWNGPGLGDFGIAPCPLPGDVREPTGHAWLVVGYDHVDGNAQWKYQGRFFCLNSWGPGRPAHAPWGKGISSLPFAALLTEGYSAFALRFPPR